MTLNVLAVSSEAFPLAKSGGLGDAVSGMVQAFAGEGVAVSLLLPSYPGAREQLQAPRELAVLPGLPGGTARLLAGYCQPLGLRVLLLENSALYDRDGLYVTEEGKGYEDNHLRFAALCHAAAVIARGLPGVQRPHIVHAHDWHAALVPLILRQMGVDDVRTMLTLHNLAFQGDFPQSCLAEIGVDPQGPLAAAPQIHGQVNFLAAGIRCADLITVVSHNYAREIMTPEFGCGLQELLRARRADVISIPNGIDTDMWNPETDPYLGNCNFSAVQPGNKLICKRRLQREFGLDQRPDGALIGMGSRLTTQKMADLAAQAIPAVLHAHPGAQVCLMGQGDRQIERQLARMAEGFPGRCSVSIGFDERRSHLLHAGADILLHGSRFEPFGLTPLYSMRYGTIPVGSRVGGMVDTIHDPGTGAPPGAMRTATGVLFSGETAYDMAHAMDRALSLYRQPELWRAMQRNGMRADFSWRKAAPAYISAFQALRPDVALGRIPERQRRPVFGSRLWQPARSGNVLIGPQLPQAIAHRRRMGQDAPAIGGQEPSVA